VRFRNAQKFTAQRMAALKSEAAWSLLFTSCQQPEELSDHQAGEGEELKGFKSSGESFAIACQAAEVRRPGKLSCRRSGRSHSSSPAYFLR